ncbi:MAG: hypothetical protein JWN93_95, partial [Hyphomicrobiales bacterium]|nr:hypothetical protein [Hyphomicrobiales bacterium]
MNACSRAQLRAVSGALALVLCTAAHAQESPAEQAYAPAQPSAPSFLSELFGAASQPAAPPPAVAVEPAPVAPAGR